MQLFKSRLNVDEESAVCIPTRYSSDMRRGDVTAGSGSAESHCFRSNDQPRAARVADRRRAAALAAHGMRRDPAGDSVPHYRITGTALARSIFRSKLKIAFNKSPIVDE